VTSASIVASHAEEIKHVGGSEEEEEEEEEEQEEEEAASQLKSLGSEFLVL